MKKSRLDIACETIDMVEEGTITAYKGFIDTPADVLVIILNGCGAAGAKVDLVPDTCYGLNIKHACNVHDYGYHAGKTIGHKNEADRRLLNNVIRLIDHPDAKQWRWLRALRKKRAKTIYYAVKHLGGPAYWDKKQKP